MSTKKGAKADEKERAEEEQEAPDPLVTHVNNILRSIFSSVEVYISIQQVYNSNGLYARKSYVSNNFKGLSPITKDFCTARVQL